MEREHGQRIVGQRLESLVEPFGAGDVVARTGDALTVARAEGIPGTQVLQAVFRWQRHPRGTVRVRLPRSGRAG
ncbi:MAG: hypothetical protein IPK20_25705 [Betaproteobacteria bacterium]|nr:hypothetical protein [Betaproteobacteria bacterium]